MTTGVQRIVTISCTDSDDARWRRRLAQKSEDSWNRVRHGFVREPKLLQIPQATSGFTRLARDAAD